MIMKFPAPLGLFALSFLCHGAAVPQPLLEPYLTPGKRVSTVRAITCNTPEQLEAVLSAYSFSYAAGRKAFEDQREKEEYDAAAEQMAPACDEVWFTAIVPVRTVSREPYRVQFADGSFHQRHIIEIKPVGPSGKTGNASYFISSRWRVISLETAL
ncbi:MAG: hypothetical protein AAGA73_01375 [Pseudomonadota bacterium]